MKRYILIAAGLLAGALLVIPLIFSANLVLAEEISPEDSDVIVNVVSSQSEQEFEVEDVLTRVVPVGGEGSQEVEPGTIQVIVTKDTTSDLPEGPPDAWGVLLEQSGSSLWMAKATTHLAAGERTCSAADSSPQVQVSLKEDTRFVEDATDFSQAQASDDPAVLNVQQVLRPVPEAGELPRCASLLVWGERQEDQLIADVILFHDELR